MKRLGEYDGALRFKGKEWCEERAKLVEPFRPYLPEALRVAVRKKRESKNLTIEQLAKEIGIYFVTLANFECGAVERPKPNTINLIQKWLEE